MIDVSVCVYVCVTHCSPHADLPGRTLGQLAAPHCRRFAGWVAEVIAQVFLSPSGAAGHLPVAHPLPTGHQALGRVERDNFIDFIDQN